MVGVNQQNMNGTNKFLLLKTIATQGPVSRIELSKKTGLSKMTVTTLIGEYIENGIIRECGTASAASGRKPTLLEAVPDSLLTLGVDIGRDFIQVGIIDLCGKVQFFEYVAVSNILSKKALLDNILNMCDRILSQTDKEKVWGIGVSTIGPINIYDGTILSPPDFNDIRNVPIAAALKERYPYPVYLENDMRSSALAELYFGNGSEYDHFVYLGISAGIGAGIVKDSKLYRGTRGLAGTLGHTIVEVDGLPCQCGNKGCFEMYSSVRAAVRWAKAHGAQPDLTWITLLEQAEAGDKICLDTIEHMYKYISMIVINIANMLDVQCIFLGGDILYGSALFIDRLNSVLREHAVGFGIGETMCVLPSKFTSNAPFIGAAAVVMENNLRSSAVSMK